MQQITIAPELKERCPALELGCLELAVTVGPATAELEAMIAAAASRIAAEIPLEAISSLPHIRSTREAYKALGKKPGRYRPSAEALLRRIVSDRGLYRINNVVDLLNYVSITSHFSIGGYDAGRIEGPAVLGIGRSGEPYEAIARGALNIAGLPVLRDRAGAFGTPTSDSGRTMVTPATTRFLMVIFNFGGHAGLPALLEETADLFRRTSIGREAFHWLVS